MGGSREKSLQPPVFALYCKNMKVYVQQYCALGRQYLLIKSIYMMAENAAHNRRSIDEKQTTGGARMIAIIDYDAGNIKSVEKPSLPWRGNCSFQRSSGITECR